MVFKCKKCEHKFLSDDIGCVCENKHIFCIECLSKIEGTKCPECSTELNDIIFK